MIRKFSILSANYLSVSHGLKNYSNPFTEPCDVQGRFANMTIGGLAGAICSPGDFAYTHCAFVCAQTFFGESFRMQARQGLYNVTCPDPALQGWKSHGSCIAHAESRGATFCLVVCTPNVILPSVGMGQHANLTRCQILVCAFSLLLQNRQMLFST